jgi:hypothetical protein
MATIVSVVFLPVGLGKRYTYRLPSECYITIGDTWLVDTPFGPNKEVRVCDYKYVPEAVAAGYKPLKQLKKHAPKLTRVHTITQEEFEGLPKRGYDFSEDQPKETSTMIKITKHSIISVNGHKADANDMSEDDLIDTIAKIENTIEALSKIKTPSTKIAARVESLSEAKSEIAAILDAR